ncbi:hypothetical protein N493_20075 (plasmid) [Clostridium botulinum B2 433]|uniref:hypothetical protein n=1 Tax=Clostridium botulinum TaxID=1491 RepID=UPI0007DED342|nr:hypothetical protein [Clostridium botulinum]KEI84177.1 hypothetical protein N493_20075 [Clostridium botulinum B2 433]
MELGNLLFGNSRGAFKFPDRQLANSSEWEALCKKAKISIFYGDPEVSRDFYGFDNEVFTVRPYCWDDDEEKAELPNFVYKPTGFEIKWYKYAFRDSYMNQNLTPLQILDIFKKCSESIRD